ncbi:DNA-directed RNA polymerase subunit beta [Camelliibacillus cellulosilyticus]|uniref:DNA-directed RNA polymerase subunit beta n=1 Tax=Camelliibacillus cellulosilyticus TaxID=2174486 RepID=A0ABV9GR20_9BACL
MVTIENDHKEPNSRVARRKAMEQAKSDKKPKPEVADESKAKSVQELQEKAGDAENVDKRETNRKEKRKEKRRLKVRLIPIWLRLIILLALAICALIVGAMIGYRIGDGNPLDVFKLHTWTHIRDIIYK